jgi:hypothetical protein
MAGQSALQLPPDQAVAAISATIVEELQPALERLAEFATLENDWDSYGAVPITPAAIDVARELAAEIISRHALSLRPAGYTFDVVPLPNGGVQLEWDIGSRHLEIAVDPVGELSYLIVSGAGDARHATSTENVARRDALLVAESIVQPEHV